MAKDAGIIVGVCEKNLASGLEMPDGMPGHAGMKKYVEAGCAVIGM